MTGAFTVEVDGLEQLQAQVRGFGPALRGAFGIRLGAVAQAGAAKVRAQLRSAPGKVDVGLTAGLAAGTTVTPARGDARTGGAVVTTTGIRLPVARQLMVYAFNKRSFRHPVHGHLDRVVTEKGRPYFGAVLDELTSDAAAAADLALADAAATITAGQVSR